MLMSEALRHAGLSFKKSPQAEPLGDVEEGRGLQAAGPGLVTGGIVSLSSSLPFTPINLIFRVGYAPVTLVCLDLCSGLVCVV